MKKALSAALLLLAAGALAQPPQRPLIPLNAYALEGYRPIPVEEAFDMTGGTAFASVASVAFNTKGNLVVLHRGSQPFLEFDASGKLLRTFGTEGMFNRSHGLHIDAGNNLWVTDVSAHVVMKLDADGKVLMTLGTPGQSGEWNEAAGSRLFNQPNEVALDAQGNIYVAQGHGPAEPRVLKFSPSGEFITQWGSRGEGPGQFAVAHSIEIDGERVYVADRENFRVQIFDLDGKFQEEWKFNAMACAIYKHDDGFMYMTTGFDGEFAKLDMMGNVIGSLGRPGRENGQFGEAHYIALDANGHVYVADVVNPRVQVYRKEGEE